MNTTNLFLDLIPRMSEKKRNDEKKNIKINLKNHVNEWKIVYVSSITLLLLPKHIELLTIRLFF